MGLDWSDISNPVLSLILFSITAGAALLILPAKFRIPTQLEKTGIFRPGVLGRIEGDNFSFVQFLSMNRENE